MKYTTKTMIKLAILFSTAIVGLGYWFMNGCGAQVSLTASVPEGKDLDVTIKTSETPGN